jgi:general secretion pathway protein L
MLRDYFDWWTGQMLEFVPQRLKEAAADEVEALVIEPDFADSTKPPSFSLTLLKGRRSGLLGRFPLDETGLEAARQAISVPNRARAIWLRLPSSVILEKHLTLPAATERDIGRVLSYEMDRETPFSVDEVWWSFIVEKRDRALGKLQVRLSIVPKAVIAALIDLLTRAGFAPTSLDLPISPTGSQQIALGGDERRRGRWPTRAQPLALAACGVLALATIIVPFVRQSLALSAVEDQIADLKPQVDEAEKLEQQLAGAGGSDLLRSERARLGNPIAVLAATTSLMPDDTYLTDFTMQQRKLTLNGQSVGPAKLIGALAGSPTFKDPAFSAPVTHTDGARSDGFSITAEARP